MTSLAPCMCFGSMSMRVSGGMLPWPAQASPSLKRAVSRLQTWRESLLAH